MFDLIIETAESIDNTADVVVAVLLGKYAIARTTLCITAINHKNVTQLLTLHMPL